MRPGGDEESLPDTEGQEEIKTSLITTELSAPFPSFALDLLLPLAFPFFSGD